MKTAADLRRVSVDPESDPDQIPQSHGACGGLPSTGGGSGKYGTAGSGEKTS